MTLRHLQFGRSFGGDGRAAALGACAQGRCPLGHAHAGERLLSRGGFLKSAAGATGLALTSSFFLPAVASAQGAPSDPKPIAGGIQPGGPGTPVLHIFLPEEGAEPSTIGDFNGFVARADITGTGTGTDASGATKQLNFDVDNAFYTGSYVGIDGRVRTGTFGFI